MIAPGATSIVETIEHAPSSAALRARLDSAQAVVLSIQESPSQPRVRPAARPARVADIAWWCRELATLLRAGMTVVEAIDVMHAHRTADTAQGQDELLRHLRQGKPLSEAMQACGGFPQLLIANVRASERTSTLQAALQDYLIYHEQMQALRSQAVSAAIYPVVVIGFGLLIGIFLILYVMPRLAKMYGTFHGHASAATEAMIWLSKHMLQDWRLFATGLVFAVAGSVLAWRRGWLQAAAVRFVLRVPMAGNAVWTFRSFQLYQSLALTLRGGYSLSEALEVCRGQSLGERMTGRLSEALARIGRGEAASVAFLAAGLSDEVAHKLLAVGERTGQFPEVLQILADRQRVVFTAFVQRTTRLLEPVLLMLVAVVVGGIVVMMYLPIFDMANSMQ